MYRHLTNLVHHFDLLAELGPHVLLHLAH